MNLSLYTPRICILIILCFLTYRSFSQDRIALTSDLVFDGHEFHESWVVVVEGNSIVYAGDKNEYDYSDAELKEFPGSTLMPGMIEGHGHLFLYPITKFFVYPI